MSHADDVLEAKIALEGEIARPIYRACLRYLSAWVDARGELGMFARVAHQQSIEALLIQHYARVVMVMTGRTPGRFPRIEEAALSMRHAERLRSRAQNQAMMIVAGMDRDLARALIEVESGAKGVASDFETKKSKWSVQYLMKWKESAKRAAEKIKKRIKALANKETQEPAEESRFEWVKQNEADSDIFHVWHSLMDGRERPAHHEAHEQERRIDLPFDVGGEKLMFPGDQSRGASLSNVINCRCYLSYFARRRSDGATEPMDIETPSIPAKRTWHRGDRFGKETPVTPTTSVTLNGNTRARIVLPDKTFATMRQEGPGLITIVRGREQIARATHSGGSVTSIAVSPAYQGTSLETMIRRSVSESFNRAPR